MDHVPILTFEVLLDYEMRKLSFIGPEKPVTDYRVAAGLLYERSHSGSRRWVNFGRVGKNFSTIQLWWNCSTRKIIVKNSCIQLLHSEGFLDGQLNQQGRLTLNRDGARQVVTDWFKQDSDVFECLMAGAIYNTESHSLSWR